MDSMRRMCRTKSPKSAITARTALKVLPESPVDPAHVDNEDRPEIMANRDGMESPDFQEIKDRKVHPASTAKPAPQAIREPTRRSPLAERDHVVLPAREDPRDLKENQDTTAPSVLQVRLDQRELPASRDPLGRMEMRERMAVPEEPERTLSTALALVGIRKDDEAVAEAAVGELSLDMLAEFELLEKGFISELMKTIALSILSLLLTVEDGELCVVAYVEYVFIRDHFLTRTAFPML